VQKLPPASIGRTYALEVSYLPTLATHVVQHFFLKHLEHIEHVLVCGAGFILAHVHRTISKRLPAGISI
jgi:hypothetical protein